jgi:hypothetical protein
MAHTPQKTQENRPREAARQLHQGEVMRHLLKLTAVLGLLLFASPASAQVSFGFSFGTPPPPPRAYRVMPQPGSEFVWVEGYWYPNGRRWAWHDGYWTRPPYDGASWVDPYWEGGRYFEGYWYTPRGDFRHDHRWDRDRRRDERRDRREDRREERREDRR